MKSRKDGQTLYLMPETDLIASRIEELRDYFSEQLEVNKDFTLVILEVSGVDFVDSLGINLIVGLYRQVTTESKRMEIIGAGKDFMKVANFFRLPSIFTVKGEKEA